MYGIEPILVDLFELVEEEDNDDSDNDIHVEFNDAPKLRITAVGLEIVCKYKEQIKNIRDQFNSYHFSDFVKIKEMLDKLHFHEK